MIARDALYTFIENLIAGSDPSDALDGAESARNLKLSIDKAQKVVRVDIVDGMMTVSDEEMRQESDVRFTIQFWCTPDAPTGGDELAALDTAKDTSFDMARQFFDALHNDQTLGGTVCIADADYFETGQANIGGGTRGVTYLDGVVNPASFG
jgi:hypothetical protein